MVMIASKLLLALSLLVLAGVGGAQRNPPQVIKYPNLTDIEVEWMQFISLRFEVCYDEEPRVNYTFRVHFNSSDTRRCEEGTYDDIVAYGYTCSVKNARLKGNHSCQDITIGVWNRHGYNNLFISLEIFNKSDLSPMIGGNFSLTFFSESTMPTTIVSTTDGTNISKVSGNRERDLAAGISVPSVTIIVLLSVVVIIMSVIIIRQCNNNHRRTVATSSSDIIAVTPLLND